MAVLRAKDQHMDVAAWLKGLGLGRYEAAFRDNEIDRQVLTSLTADDLKEIGIAAVGHRRRLIEAIAALRAAAEPAAELAPVPPHTAVAERRQLTVMFCDLVGSTGLATCLDPEDLREIIGAYHRAVAETVPGFDGFVAKYMGDGVLIYFGYPRAHEDDAERAIRAGLGLIDAVGRLDVGSVRFQARVGIATGLVVVGDLIGEGTPNPNYWLGIMQKPGWSKNRSPIGVRPVRGPPPGRRWRKRWRNCTRGWTSWRCCRTSPNARDGELEFWSALGAVLQALKGQAAPETGHAYARARELWEQLGSPSEFLHIPYAQSLHHVFRGELDLAQRLDEDLLRLSRQRNDSTGLVLGHISSGQTLLFAGGFASSRSHFEEALALYDPILCRSLARHAGPHPQVSALGYLGIDLLCLGYPHQALVQSRAAIAKVRGLAHPPSLAASLALGTLLLLLSRDNVALDKWAGQLVAVATEQGFSRWHAQGTICRGWVKVKTGDVVEGISLLRSGSKAYRATGSLSWMPQYFALLAEGM